jgi:hypothetical protein
MDGVGRRQPRPAVHQGRRTAEPRQRALFILGPLACLLFATNIVVGSVAVYALALCLQLSVAVVSFYMLIAAASS